MKNIQKYGLLIVVALAGIVVSGWFLYTQKINEGVIENKITFPAKEEEVVVMVDENIVPEWVKYTHPSLGYTIEYPANILPSIRSGNASTSTFFYKNIHENNPNMGVTVLAIGMRVTEWSKAFSTPNPEKAQKITIPTIDAEAYVMTDIKHPNTIYGVNLIKDGVYYLIGFRGLSPATTDHIIKSFRIDFVPESMKVH